MLEFKIVLPPPGAADVTSRNLTVVVGTADPDVRDLAGDVLEVPGFVGNDNEQVTATLIDIDDAGNHSEPSVGQATLTDTIAPPAPGELGFQVTGEV